MNYGRKNIHQIVMFSTENNITLPRPFPCSMLKLAIYAQRMYKHIGRTSIPHTTHTSAIDMHTWGRVCGKAYYEGNDTLGECNAKSRVTTLIFWGNRRAWCSFTSGKISFEGWLRRSAMTYEHVICVTDDQKSPRDLSASLVGLLVVLG